MTHFYFQEIGLGEVFCDRELQNNPFSVPLRAALASVMFLVLLTWQKLCRGDVQRSRAWPQSAEPSAGNANPIGKKLFISERKKKTATKSHFASQAMSWCKAGAHTSCVEVLKE